MNVKEWNKHTNKQTKTKETEEQQTKNANIIKQQIKQTKQKQQKL